MFHIGLVDREDGRTAYLYRNHDHREECLRIVSTWPEVRRVFKLTVPSIEALVGVVRCGV